MATRHRKLFAIAMLVLALSAGYTPPNISAHTGKAPATPQTVVPIGQAGGSMPSVTIAGQYAYIGNGQRVLVLDVANPAQPVLMGRTPMLPEPAVTVTASGATVYLADGVGGLRVLNVADPGAPNEIGAYASFAGAHSVAVRGDYAYVADQNGDLGGSLHIVDLTNPADPVELGVLSSLGYLNGVAISGTYAYAAAGSAGLYAIDVANPLTPTLAGTYNSPGFAYDVVVTGTYAYLADDFGGLRVLSLADPRNPAFVAAYTSAGAIWDVAVQGNLAYLAGYDNYSLEIVSIANPGNPTFVGRHSYQPWSPWTSAVDGTLAYLTDSGTHLQILDVSNPISPTLVGQYTSAEVVDVAAAGSYAYVAAGGNGLRVLDVSTPSLPVEVASYDTAGTTLGVTVAGNRLYLADERGGLYIVAFSGTWSNRVLLPSVLR
jgi:hypothetical protein